MFSEKGESDVWLNFNFLGRGGNSFALLTRVYQIHVFMGPASIIISMSLCSFKIKVYGFYDGGWLRHGREETINSISYGWGWHILEFAMGGEYFYCKGDY